MTERPFKPLLSGKAPADLSKLRYPLLASPKLDGIRCVIHSDLGPVTRSLKPIPNEFVRRCLEKLPSGLDGELLLRDWTAPFCEVSSAIMSRDGEPDFTYAVFDLLTAEGPTMSFAQRYKVLEWVVGDRAQADCPWLVRVRHEHVMDADTLMRLDDDWTGQGFEGTMVRDPFGVYKYGRSTLKEGILLKIKRWADEEAVVLAVIEQMHNTNEAKVDALGHTERSTSKEGLVGKGTMGALRCRFEDGTRFEVGTGFDDETRQQVWDNTNEPQILAGKKPWPIGRLVKIKHQPAPGGRQPGQAPRFPVFLGWRED